LIHSSAPAESFIQVIEYLHCVRSVIFFKICPDLFAEPSCSRHQTTAVGVARLANTLSCRPFQLEGDTFTGAAGGDIGIQESVVETTPVLLTSSDLVLDLMLVFVLCKVASETTLHGSGRFL
tara:strand:- start:120 stop:485 length:366 start_codon:yes stop_codon:yes gene_type:complete